MVLDLAAYDIDDAYEQCAAQLRTRMDASGTTRAIGELGLEKLLSVSLNTSCPLMLPLHHPGHRQARPREVPLGSMPHVDADPLPLFPLPSSRYRGLPDRAGPRFHVAAPSPHYGTPECSFFLGGGIIK